MGSLCDCFRKKSPESSLCVTESIKNNTTSLGSDKIRDDEKEKNPRNELNEIETEVIKNNKNSQGLIEIRDDEKENNPRNEFNEIETEVIKNNKNSQGLNEIRDDEKEFNRQDGLNELDDSASSKKSANLSDSPIQVCFSCKEDSELIDLYCQRCYLCSNCLFQHLNSSISNKQSIVCGCSLPVSYSIFENLILEENLLTYLDSLSSPSFSLPLNYKCECGLLHKLEKPCNFNQCNCLKVTCLRCLQEHLDSVSCKSFYTSKKITCKICKTQEIFDLGCKCQICQRCCFARLKEQISDSPVSPLLCPVCSKILTRYEQIEICGGQNRLIKLQEDSLLSSRFTCPICWVDKVVNGSITLYCQHRFCKKCINLHILNELNSLPAAETQVHCPTCENQISYHIIDFVLDGEALKRYHKRLVMNTRLSVSDEVIKYCDVCEYAATISKNDKEFSCPNCNKRTCANCNKPFAVNCCRRQSSINFGELKELILKCPQCNCAVLKENGCNFLTCCWPQCSKISFCFLCKKVLDVNCM